MPIHILLSVCADTKTESDSFISRMVATIRQGQFVSNFKKAFRPNNQWGPANIQEKRDWQVYCEEVDLNQWMPKFIRRAEKVDMLEPQQSADKSIKEGNNN